MQEGEREMSLVETVHKDMIAAMKAREEAKLSTLRMTKSAFKMKEVEKRAPLTDAEAQAVLQTLIKQRRESVEMFTKGGRQELADKEAAEIVQLEAYLPKSASPEQIVEFVETAIAEAAAASGAKPGQKDMGAVMKAAQARIAAAGLRADGKQVSEVVRAELAK
jgi:uncharacterized protein YqeY